MSDFEEDGYSTVQSTVHNSDLVEYANKLHKGNSLLIHGLKLIKLLIGYDKKKQGGRRHWAAYYPSPKGFIKTFNP